MIDNFATVGMSYLSIYGYGPINAEVNLKGYGMSESVTSDSTGLFRFNSVYSFSYKNGRAIFLNSYSGIT